MECFATSSIRLRRDPDPRAYGASAGGVACDATKMGQIREIPKCVKLGLIYCDACTFSGIWVFATSPIGTDTKKQRVQPEPFERRVGPCEHFAQGLVFISPRFD